jgi:hypothetical protein
MMTPRQRFLSALSLAAALLPAWAGAAAIGPQQDGALGQASLLLKGADAGSGQINGFDRYAEPFWDGSLDLSALSSGVAAQTVYATGSSLRVTFGGTAAPQEARLALAGTAAELADPSRRLFETRGAGCTYADWLADEFCAIDSVGDWLDISGLSVGQALRFGLQGDTLASGDAFAQSALALFSHQSDVRWADLGGGRLLLGFELDGPADHADWVFLFDGLSLSQPQQDLPVPGTLALVLLAGWAATRGGRGQQRLAPNQP